MTEKLRFLFVYGTLRQGAGHSAHSLLENKAERIGQARMRGRLYEVDGYPGAVLADDGADRVIGELYRLLTPQAVLKALDDYEEAGEDYPEPREYRRCRVTVKQADGAELLAWCYLYNRPTVGLRLIESGDWCGEPSESC
jgi:gamma-glutamylcyclotransferase (GGCT)/AIG2-like uncharacterized protein YtfP